MKKIYVSILAAGIIMLAATSSHALILTSGISTEGLGSFAGTFNYSYVDSTTGTIVINLTNTTPLITGGYLTAFAFNNPVDILNNERITDVTGFTSTDTGNNFNLIGDSPIFTNEDIDANPFGTFDIGATVTSNGWLAGGGTSGGLAVGESATFTFSLKGVGLDMLTAESFFSAAALSSDTSKPQNFAVRFRSIPVGAGSDKVIGVPSGTVPEPATMVIFGSGLAGAFLRRRFQA